MLQLVLQSAKGNSGEAEMYIDYQADGVNFTVIHESKQFDFSIEKSEWEQFKVFIEAAMKNN
jgi:hypothetical protein